MTPKHLLTPSSYHRIVLVLLKISAVVQNKNKQNKRSEVLYLRCTYIIDRIIGYVQCLLFMGGNASQTLRYFLNSLSPAPQRFLHMLDKLFRS